MGEIVDLEGFNVIGISVVTTNQDGIGARDIGALFERFLGENLIAKIPNRVSDQLYTLYTDYVSDFRGEYRVIVGCRVDSLDSIPDGFMGRRISATTYSRYSVASSHPDSVASVWNKIWESGMERGILLTLICIAMRRMAVVSKWTYIYIVTLHITEYYW